MLPFLHARFLTLTKLSLEFSWHIRGVSFTTKYSWVIYTRRRTGAVTRGAAKDVGPHEKKYNWALVQAGEKM